MSHRFFVMVICSALLASPGFADSVSLAPSGQWAVEYGKDMCVLSRPFGEGKQRVIFSLKPAPNSDQARIMLIRQAGREDPLAGKAEVRFSDGSVPAWSQGKSATAKGIGLTSIDLPRSSLAPLEKGGSISIRFGRKTDLTLTPRDMSSAVKAWAKCEADLLKTWGMDETAQAAMASIPYRTDKGSLFNSDDYPDRLLNRGVQGTVGALLTVDAQGNVADCRAVEPSGTPELDQHTCRIFRQRARYQPAVDRDGKPMAALAFQRVNWMIGDSWFFTVNPGAPTSAPMSTRVAN